MKRNLLKLMHRPGRAFCTLMLSLMASGSLAAQGFSEVTTGFPLPGVSQSSTAWGDYDNDGKLDVVINGIGAGGLMVAKIYRNTGSGFEEMAGFSLIGVQYSSVAWGDYDNDGKLDVALNGLASTGETVSNS